MYYRQKLLSKLERRFGRFAIQNLMLIIVGAMAIVFLMDMLITPIIGQRLSSILIFDLNAILSGQVWRVFTFLFVPPSTSIIFIIFSLYFYWLIGSALENYWGSFGFTLYYLIGALGALISGFISGYATNNYLNLSLFFAFALLNPDFPILLFFFLPIKIKYLAILNAVSFIFMFSVGNWSDRIALLASIINILIFFTPDFIDYIKSFCKRLKNKGWNK